MAATSPIVLLILNFGIYLIAPSVGKFVMPIALNVGFSAFFLLSLIFGDLGGARKLAIHQAAQPAA